jgi:putative YhdH/YhfP family quinone oxidoreductase
MQDQQFTALVVYETRDKGIHRRIEQKKLSSLPAGDVLVHVRYSSLNYKDALSASGNRGVTKHYPHTPGIDAAGIIVASNDPRWREGEEVLCTGYDLGMNTSGGFGQYIRVPSNWLVRLPEGLSLLESMRLGTAGFTAGQCIWHLERNNIVPGRGPVLVTGATGGVGSIAILLLHKLGYEIVAATGKDSEHAFLTSLGATEILKRDAFLAGSDKQLLPIRWQGVVDTIGGTALAAAIKSTGFDGVVTCCGNAASGDLPLSVYPFILRGVHLIGVYSANCSMEKRLQVWEKLAGDWKIEQLAAISRIVALEGLEGEIQAMLAGQSKGRCVVALGGEVDVP